MAINKDKDDNVEKYDVFSVNIPLNYTDINLSQYLVNLKDGELVIWNPQKFPSKSFSQGDK